MSESDLTARNVAQVGDIYARYARGDRGAVLGALAPDVRWSSIGGEALSWAGERRGRAGVEAYFAALDAEVSQLGYEVERVIAQGEWIAVLATVTVRYRGNGRECRYAKADFIRMVDGHLADFREFYDTAQACRDQACY